MCLDLTRPQPQCCHFIRHNNFFKLIVLESQTNYIICHADSADRGVRLEKNSDVCVSVVKRQICCLIWRTCWKTDILSKQAHWQIALLTTTNTRKKHFIRIASAAALWVQSSPCTKIECLKLKLKTALLRKRTQVVMTSTQKQRIVTFE